MHLKKVHIENFRSIKNSDFVFKHNFMIMVGINESGKSNILKALSYLSNDAEYSKDDIRDPGHDEEPVDSSFIRFIFRLSNNEINKVIESMQEQLLCVNTKSSLMTFNNTDLSLQDICKLKNEFLYTIDIVNMTTSCNSWRRETYSDALIKPNWKKVKEKSSYIIQNKSKEMLLSQYKFVNINDYAIPVTETEDLHFSDINTAIAASIIRLFKENMPRCIKWAYNEQNLLPEKIKITDFVATPDSCIPLKNMFALAGHYDVKKAIDEAKLKTNGLRNLLTKVAENTTSHMRRVWPEWKKQKVFLNYIGDYIEAGIQDEFNVYSLSRRSDGFKRFFSFLLMISAQSKTKNIQNNLILIDEPDVCLHPTGIQYLRDELKKISSDNNVAVSTHSIFMIDKEIAERHLIIEKNKEITTIKPVTSSNISDEEVILRALGYSVYELLKPINLIFEGWRDKKVFEVFINKSDLIKEIRKLEVGYLHAAGVKDISRISNLCENFSRKYVIITDSDPIALSMKSKYDGQGPWICYKDVTGVNGITTEDFIDNKLINVSIKGTLERNGEKASIILPDSCKTDKIKYIESKLKDIYSAEEIKDIMYDIKQYIVDNVKYSDINNNYASVVKDLVDKLKA